MDGQRETFGMSKRERIRYYRSFSDDFEVTAHQDISLGDDYQYIRDGFFSRLRSGITYTAALVFGWFYCTFVLHTRYVNRKVLKKAKGQGIFIYANHTQPVGDVVLPAFAAFPRRIYTVVSPANFGIPFIGSQLPYLGAIPVGESLGTMKEFNSAIEKRIHQKKIITIYPEAHVWEYYTHIRSYDDVSFKYPAKLKKPVFSMTVTYKKSRFLRRPVTVVYIDGPFYPDEELSLRSRARDLRDRVYKCMCERSHNSNTEYIVYKKFPDML